MLGEKLAKMRIKQLLASGQDGQEIVVNGWVRSKRVSKNFAFLVINDGSTQLDLQAVVDAGTNAYEELGQCSTGAAVRLQGVLKSSPGKGQAWEIQARELKILGASPDDYPLQKKGHSLEFLREISHLRPRSHTFGAVFRVRNQLAMLVHEFFQSRGFIWAHTPILTSSDCEGAGELFQVTNYDIGSHLAEGKKQVDWSEDFFGKKTHLTVSGQLNGEALALSMGDIYTFGPTFRAENSHTTRHLAEFWMVEPEMAFAELSDDMALAEDFLRYLFGKIVEKCPDELGFLSKHYKDMSPEQLVTLAEKPFQVISYTDAIEELSKSKSKFEFPVNWGIDLQTEHERYLTDVVFRKPVIVTDYPKDIKAFYMRLNDDEKTVAAMDVLVPRIGEIIGGSQREDRYDLLKARMIASGIQPEELQWYLDLRRYGSAPHAGFGLGFERLVQYVTGMTNIRDVIAFPRFAGAIAF